MTPIRPIALTMGDPSGIGPEMTAKIWQNDRGEVPFCFIGDPSVLSADLPTQVVSSIDDVSEVFWRALPILPMELPVATLPGQPSEENAEIVIGSVRKAVDLTMSGKTSAVVTNPINKKVLYDGAGFGFPGHTEFLAELAGVPRTVMMLAGPSLKVVPVTIHIPLAEVPSTLTRSCIIETVQIVRDALQRDFRIERPRIAVAGLNPHAGESGAMGTEDHDLIAPAIEDLKAKGLEIRGPLPADTMFHAAARRSYDVAITMYHDQGLIPIKALDFDEGVNVTLGLPFIRTSPDHGTAYDIAGKGFANPSSLKAAIDLAGQLALCRGEK